MASSTSRMASSKITASATTLSPASRTKISPTTTSSDLMTWMSPFRSTFVTGEVIFFKASRSFRVLPSWNTLNNAFPNTIKKTTTTSTYIVMISVRSALFCTVSKIAKIKEMIAEIINKMFKGSINCFKKRMKGPGGFFSSKTLAPYFFLDANTCSSFKPSSASITK